MVAVALAVSLASAATALGATGALAPKGCWGDPSFNPSGCAHTTAGLPDGQLAFGQAIDVAASADGISVYAVAQSAAGYALVTFARDPASGALTPLGCIGEAGANPGCAQTTKGLATVHSLAISPDDRSVYTYGDAIVHFRRNVGTGVLTPVDCVGEVGNNQAGCARTARALGRVDIPLSNDIAVSSDGTSVYAVGNQAILRLNRDATTGSLKPMGCIADAANNPGGCQKTAPVLNEPQSLALTADGRSLYATTVGDLAVVHFQRASSGALSFAGCVKDSSGAAACPKKANGLFGPTDVVASPDGKSLYVAAIAGDSTIVRFSRNTANGGLTPKGCIGSDADGQCGSNPGDLSRLLSLAVSADGQSLYGAGDYDVVWFSRAKDGALKHRGCVRDPVSSTPPCTRNAKGVMYSRALALSPGGDSLYDGTGSALVRFARSP